MPSLPYKIAALCYLYDTDGRLLLLHRNQQPNKGMYSPIGGKLDITTGEAPHQCAVREIHEETGIEVAAEDVRLTGIVSERAYQLETHWLIFLFEVTKPIAPDALKWTEFDEGVLEWVDADAVHDMDIPRTDREVLWPLVRAHQGSGYFVVHIAWNDDDTIEWTVHESVKGRDSVV